MRSNILPVLSLLLGTAFLLAGNGLHGLLLPMRGSAEGFSPTSLGLLGPGRPASCLAAFFPSGWCAGSVMFEPFRRFRR
jgi:hypothetical protein